MQLHAFDIATGYYHFSVTALRAAAHRHPLTEILLATGPTTYDIARGGGEPSPTHCTCVRAQETHAVTYAGLEPLHVVLLERPDLVLDGGRLVPELLAIRGARTQVQSEVKKAVEAAVATAAAAPGWDDRGRLCYDFINTHAAALPYAGLGYTQEAVIRDYWGPGDDKLVFRKRLARS